MNHFILWSPKAVPLVSGFRIPDVLIEGVVTDGFRAKMAVANVEDTQAWDMSAEVVWQERKPLDLNLRRPLTTWLWAMDST